MPLTVERRTFLAAASAVAWRANAERDTTPFKAAEIEVAGNKIFYRRSGQGPAIFLVHGFPRTSLMWRFLAQKLAVNFTVICPDLRAYG